MRKTRARTTPRRIPARRIGSGHFAAADYLKSEVAIREYLAATVADPNPDAFLATLGGVGKSVLNLNTHR